MTDEDLDRIDAECARHVMGVAWDEKRCRVCGWPLVPEGEAGCWASNCSMRPMPAERADRHAKYTRSWSDAGEVVEKMRPTHHVLIEGYWQGRWEVQFCVPSTEYTATAETLPLAITLAALSACGHQWKGTT